MKDENLDMNSPNISVAFLTDRGLDRSFAEAILGRVKKDDAKESGASSKAKDKEAAADQEVVAQCRQLLERVVNLQATGSSKQCASCLLASLASPLGPPSVVSSPLLPDAVPEPFPEIGCFGLTRDSHLPGSIRFNSDEEDA